MKVLLLICLSATALALLATPRPHGETAPPATIVAIGDSITWRYQDRRASWPDDLSRMLHVPVLNRGIGGNAVTWRYATPTTPPLAERFAADALDAPGVRTVIVLEGINDIRYAGRHPEGIAADVIATVTVLIDQAHAHGVRVVLGTLLPYGRDAAWNPAGEREREAINRWIRTQGVADGVVDFDRAMRDPGHPLWLLPRYDNGDGIHPNVPGERAIADAAAKVLHS